MLRREFLGLLALGCGEDMASYPSSPNKYPSTPNKYPVTPKAYPSSSAAAFPSGNVNAFLTGISGVAAIWLAEDLSSYGSGNAVTGNWVDRKNGYVLAPFAANMGTYQSNAFRNGSVPGALRMVTKAARSTDAALANIFAGTNKSYTVIMLCQRITGVATYYWMAGNNSLFNEYVGYRFATGSTKNEMLMADGLIAPNPVATEYQDSDPQLMRWERVGSTSWKTYKDEIVEQSFAQSDSGIACQHFGIGLSSVGSASSAVASMDVSAVIVVDTSGLAGNVMTTADINAVKAWAATRLGTTYKKNLITPTWTSTKVVWTTGQSNAPLEGRASATPYITLTAPNAYAHSCDGYLRAGNDPAGDNTNTRWPAMSHAGAVGSSVPSLLNALYTQGAYNGTTEAMVIGGWALGATTAASWASGTAPGDTTLMGVAMLRLITLMRNLPSPVLYVHFNDQGEDNSVSAPLAAAWAGDTTTVCNTVETFATTMGWTWSKTNLRHYIQALSDDQAGSASLPNGATVQTAQLAFPAGRAANNCLARKAANGNMVAADNIHFNTAAWANFIPTMVTDIVGAT